MTEAFKVTRRNSLGHRSCIVNTLGGLYYYPGEKTRATIGGCLVFGRIEDAEEFMHIWGGTDTRAGEICLWRCEASEPLDLGLCLDTLWLDQKTMTAAWRGDIRLSMRSITRPWPRGTLAFKEVTLTEQLLGPGMEA